MNFAVKDIRTEVDRSHAAYAVDVLRIFSDHTVSRISAQSYPIGYTAMNEHILSDVNNAAWFYFLPVLYNE